MVEITFNITELENKLKLTISTVEQSVNLESLFSSPNLPSLVGQTAQRTIDKQDYPELTKAYKKIRVKRFGNRPFERLTDALYNRLKVGNGFNFSLSSSKQQINVSITDPVARGQQRLKRFIFIPDQQLADDLAKNLNQNLTTKLSKLFN
jgi:hypothetical protein